LLVDVLMARLAGFRSGITTRLLGGWLLLFHRVR
jgi:hypothetical protein